MTKRELKRLSRADLLAMLIEKTKENDRLRAELDEIKAAENNRAMLNERSVVAEPIAVGDARMDALLNAFEAAAKQYLQNVRALTEDKAE